MDSPPSTGLSQTVAGDRLADDLGGDALVIAVVPLEQVGAGLGLVQVAGQLAGAPSGRRAAQDEGELAAVQQATRGRGLHSPSGRSGRSVRPVWRPFSSLGGAVADDENLVAAGLVDGLDAAGLVPSGVQARTGGGVGAHAGGSSGQPP